MREQPSQREQTHQCLGVGRRKRDRKYIKKDQTETLMLNNSIIELKISLENFKSRLNQAEQRTIKLKEKTLEKIQGVKISKKRKEYKNLKNL